jgi:hypothetical protein
VTTIMTASIAHNDRDGRVALECRDEGNGWFCWYAQEDDGSWTACDDVDGEIGRHDPAAIARSAWRLNYWDLWFAQEAP